jgi:hypothetical protein
MTTATIVAAAHSPESRLPGQRSGRTSASRRGGGLTSIQVDPVVARPRGVQDVARGCGLAARLLWV